MAIRKVIDHNSAGLREEALELLQKWVPAGSTVAGVYMAGNRTGDGHTIKLLAAVNRGDNSHADIVNISYAMARVLGRNYDDTHHGVRFNGGGIDPVAALAYSLSMALYGDGYKINSKRV